MNFQYRIRYLPISSFSIILGLSGLTIVYQKAETVLQIPFQISGLLLISALFLFGSISLIYLYKLIRYPAYVKEEFEHPVKLSFFPAFSVSFLLLSVALLSANRSLSAVFWITGTLLHLSVTIRIFSIWMHHNKFEVVHLNPSWFIPSVGNILIPIAGVSHFNPEISWFFYSIGLIFWIVLFVIFIYRIIFHHPLPEKLLPTFFILIAPPAVGFIAYVKLTGEITNFAKILFYFAMFLVILLISQIRLFYRIRFHLSWWAYSFPLAALTIANILMYHETGQIFFSYTALFLLGAVSLLIFILIIKTVLSFSAKQICIAEE